MPAAVKKSIRPKRTVIDSTSKRSSVCGDHRHRTVLLPYHALLGERSGNRLPKSYSLSPTIQSRSDWFYLGASLPSKTTRLWKECCCFRCGFSSAVDSGPLSSTVQ